jgi:predicted LPLAT superfamily acyltransferase
VVVVDDGSAADTRAILDDLEKRNSSLSVVRRATNGGKGAAVATGLNHVAHLGFSHALQIDADGQHDPADIPHFLAAAREQPDAVIIGRPRFDASMPTSRRVGRYLTHLWIWIETLSLDISDSMCGFRVYPLAAVLPLLARPGLGRRMDFDPEILVRLHWRGTPVVEIDTRVRYPAGGLSNFALLRDNVLISLMHTRLVVGMLLRLPWLLPRRLAAARDRRSEHAEVPSAGRSAGRHWAELSERGTLLGLRLMLFIYQVFGHWLFRPVAFVVAGYFTLSAGRARRASAQYLNQVWTWGRDRTGLQRPPDRWTTFAHFRSFADAVLDKVAAWRGDIRYEQIDHDNLELFESRRAAGRGGVWITSHLGNIEVCRAIGQQERDFQLTVLTHTRHAANFNRLLEEVAPGSHVELLEVSEFDVATALKLSERVNRGGFIVIVGDRVPLGNSARVQHCQFLGRPAAFPVGPFLLAALLGCPAGTLFCVKAGDRYRLIIDDLPGLAGVDRAHRQAAIESAIRTFAGRLESLCLRYPLQWFNFFPFWTDADDAR